MKLIEIGMVDGEYQVWLHPMLRESPDAVSTILGKAYGDLHPSRKLRQHTFHVPSVQQEATL